MQIKYENNKFILEPNTDTEQAFLDSLAKSTRFVEINRSSLCRAIDSRPSGHSQSKVVSD